jgi:myo-inositol-1(or 4)-monophosphatase
MPPKGRLIRCTVPGSTPNRFAILRTPSVRPVAFKAARMRASTSGALRVAGPRKLLERLTTRQPSYAVVPRLRSLALRMVQVAQGTCDVAIAGPNSHDWDLAAADLLVHEARGVLAPVGGGSVVYNRPAPRHGMLIAAGRDRYAAFAELIGDERLAFS